MQTRPKHVADIVKVAANAPSEDVVVAHASRTNDDAVVDAVSGAQW